MNEQEILAGAPEGFTDVNHIGNVYYKFNGINWEAYDNGESYLEYELPMCRSLADIARIAELELFLDRMLKIEYSRGGSLDASGQFMYKTPESIFKQAKQLREGVNNNEGI